MKYRWILGVSIFLACALAAQAQWSTDPTINNAISTASGHQDNPAIVSDGAGGAIIAWQDYRSGTNYDIYAQRINASGGVQWAVNGVPISTASGYQSDPKVISDGAGGAIITWLISDISGNYGYDIYTQRVDASGIVQWASNGVPIATRVSNPTIPDQGVRETFSDIASDQAGGAIITWYEVGSNGWNIYAQRINASGVVQWTPDGKTINVNSDKGFPTIAGDGAGGAIITWEERRNNTHYDIYAQRINANGVVQWTTDGVAISTASESAVNDRIYYNPLYPTLVSDGAGGAIITWYDYRSGTSYDIYAQRVRSDGTLGGNEAPVASAGADQTVIVTETVQLNGSGSSDADGNPLTYSWEITSWPTGSTATLSNRFIVNPTFVADVAGVYVVTLTVNDGTVNSAPDQVVITVLTPSEAVQSLKGQVQALIAAGVLNENGNGLLAQLERIIDKLEDRKIGPAINQLGAFIQHVTDLIPGKLTPAQGESLIAAATRIRAALGG